MKSSTSLDLAQLGVAVQRLEQHDEARRSQVDSLRSLVQDSQEGMATLNERVNGLTGGQGRQSLDGVCAEVERMHSEVGTLRAHATATASAIARMEEMHREAALVRQEVGVLRSEQMEFQRSLRQADARAVEQAATISSLQNALSGVEHRCGALVTSTTEAQERLGREVAESRTDYREAIELLVTDMKLAKADATRAEQEIELLKGGQELLTRQLQAAQQQQQAALEEVVRRLQHLTDRFDLAEREASQQWEHYEQRRGIEDSTVGALEAKASVLQSSVEELRRMLGGWETLFTVVGALGYMGSDMGYLGFQGALEQGEPYSPVHSRGWPRAPPATLASGAPSGGGDPPSTHMPPPHYVSSPHGAFAPGTHMPSPHTIPSYNLPPPIEVATGASLSPTARGSPLRSGQAPSPPSPSSCNSAATTPTTGRGPTTSESKLMRQLRAAMRLQVGGSRVV